MLIEYRNNAIDIKNNLKYTDCVVIICILNLLNYCWKSLKDENLGQEAGFY